MSHVVKSQRPSKLTVIWIFLLLAAGVSACFGLYERYQRELVAHWFLEPGDGSLDAATATEPRLMAALKVATTRHKKAVDSIKLNPLLDGITDGTDIKDFNERIKTWNAILYLQQWDWSGSETAEEYIESHVSSGNAWDDEIRSAGSRRLSVAGKKGVRGKKVPVKP